MARRDPVRRGIAPAKEPVPEVARPSGMTDRDAALLALRPQVDAAPEEAVSEVEAFLHRTLRPVLKLQNDPLLALVAADLRKRVSGFAAFAPDDARERLVSTLKADARLKRVLLGLVLGMLTTDELAFALENDAEVRRRVMLLVVERVRSQAEAVQARV